MGADNERLFRRGALELLHAVRSGHYLDAALISEELEGLIVEHAEDGAAELSLLAYLGELERGGAA